MICLLLPISVRCKGKKQTPLCVTPLFRLAVAGIHAFFFSFQGFGYYPFQHQLSVIIHSLVAQSILGCDIPLRCSPSQIELNFLRLEDMNEYIYLRSTLYLLRQHSSLEPFNLIISFFVTEIVLRH